MAKSQALGDGISGAHGEAMTASGTTMLPKPRLSAGAVLARIISFLFEKLAGEIEHQFAGVVLAKTGSSAAARADDTTPVSDKNLVGIGVHLPAVSVVDPHGVSGVRAPG
jgi:hypothetical protein